MDVKKEILFRGELKIGELHLPCYVTEGGNRVLSGRGVQNLLGLTDTTTTRTQVAGSRLRRLFSYSAFKPVLVDKFSIDRLNVQKYKDGGTTIIGFDAPSIVDLCDAIMDVRDTDPKPPLTERQKHIIRQAEIFVRTVAKVGIIALIDEATGYQYFRARNALEEILEKFIAKELQAWAKTFSDEFYEQLFRLRGWQYVPFNVKRPAFIGKLTNDLVYARLAPYVLDELRQKNPVTPKGYRKTKHHQWLTQDIGHPKLREHIASVTTLMKASSNWRSFYSMVQRALPKYNETLNFQLDFDDEIV